MWGYEGEPPAGAVVTLHPDGSVTLLSGASDLGTGAKTVLAMVVAEELGVGVPAVEVENADTATTPYSPAAAGSQTVVINAPAVRAAAAEVRRQLLELAAGELKRPVAELSVRDGAIVSGGATKPVPFGELKSLAERQGIQAMGHRGPQPEGKVALPFVAQFAEVEVDRRTGEVRVVRMLAAHDSGRVMNRMTYENQVFGGLTMGLGYALSEGRVLDRQTGRMVNANWHDYKIATAMDAVPDLTCLPVDPHDVECNTSGAKGLGEPATIPTAAAIGNAIYHATGVRVTETPVTPARMLKALAERRKKG
jgi:xanthine dehydrogenase YagR molybdenum-binding subunit